jgi:hypothetical protein
MRRFLFLLSAAAISTASGSSGVPDTLAAPQVSYNLSLPDYNCVTVTIYDKSNCETGYRIYRDSGFTSNYPLIAQTISTEPANHDTITFSDYTVKEHSVYHYVVAAYNAADSISSSPVEIINAPLYVVNRLEDKSLPRGKLQAISDNSKKSVTIILPSLNINNAELVFYDLYGRIVEKMSGINANSVTWKPKRNSEGGYIAAAKIDGVRYLARFIIK